MSGEGYTLGHVFLAMAALQLVYALYIGFVIMRADPETPPERLRGFKFILFASLACAVGLALFSKYLPHAQIRLG